MSGRPNESAAFATWRAQPRKLSSDTVVRNGLDVFLQESHESRHFGLRPKTAGLANPVIPENSARSLHSLCAGSGLFYFWRKAFFHSVAEVLNFPGYRATSFFSPCWCEQHSHPYSEADSSCKANRVTDPMVLLPVNRVSGSAGEVLNPTLYTVRHVSSITVRLFK